MVEEIRREIERECMKEKETDMKNKNCIIK